MSRSARVERLRALRACLLTTCLVAFASIGQRSLCAQAEAFDPAEHLPGPCLAHVSVENIAGLRKTFAGTLIGRILTHPGVQEAFATPLEALRRELDRETGELREITGLGLFELIDLLQGRVSITLRGLGPDGPDLCVAIGLNENREKILGLLARMRQLADDEGLQIDTAKQHGLTVNTWNIEAPISAVHEVVVGDCVLFLTRAETLGDIVALRSGSSDFTKLGETEPVSKVLALVDVPQPLVVVAADLRFLRQLALQQLFENFGREDGERIARVSGLDTLATLGWVLGTESEASDAASRSGLVLLGEKEAGGVGGFPGIVLRNLRPVGDVTPFLEKTPANAQQVLCASADIGKMAREIDAYARREFPKLAGELDGIYSEVEKYTGLSIRDDVMQLGEGRGLTFSAPPPAGGLLPDSIAVLETTALEPGWKLIEKVAREAKAVERQLDGLGASVRYIHLGSGYAPDADELAAFIRDFPGNLDEERFVRALALGGMTFARADAGDGYSVFSSLPQALLRYAAFYAKGPRLSEADPLAKSLMELSGDSSMQMAFRTGDSTLWVWNTLISLANSLSSYGTIVGVELQRLPPAEEFLSSRGVGSCQVLVHDGGLVVRGRQTLESGAPLIVVATAAVVAGLVTPVLFKGRGKAIRIQSTNGLKQIGFACFDYANANGGSFPHDPRGSIETLNLLLASPSGKLLDPKLFVKSDGFAEPAERDAAGDFVLSALNSSYTIVEKQLSAEGKPRVLVYETYPRADGTRLVLFTDLSVEELDGFEFDEALRKTLDEDEDEDL